MVRFTNPPPHRYLTLPPSTPLRTSWLLPAPPHPSLPLLSVPCRVCSEKHREKSREAARSQREKESEVFTQLALQLDKVSIVRVTLSYLRLRELLHTEAGCGEVDNEVERTAPVETSIEGFLLLLSQDGVIIYTSEEVTRHTGLSQATSTSVL